MTAGRIADERVGEPVEHGASPPVTRDKMPDADYPTVYGAANAAARYGNRRYKRFVQIELLLLVTTAALGLLTFSTETAIRWGAAGQAVLMLAAFIAPLVNRFRAYSQQWFESRAVSETIKTSTWRYMMRVEPYDGDDAAADKLFTTSIKETLQTRGAFHRGIFTALSDGLAITPFMKKQRARPWQDRHAFYLAERLGDQIRWYAQRAEANDRSAALWFWVSLGCEAAALGAAVLTVVEPGWPSVVGIFATFAAVATAWGQLGRHDELKKSYAMTAYELTFLRESVAEAIDEQTFRRAVLETEAAISREHTMWVAKRTS